MADDRLPPAREAALLAEIDRLRAELEADAGLLWHWTDLKLPKWAILAAGERAWEIGGLLGKASTERDG